MFVFCLSSERCLLRDVSIIIAEEIRDILSSSYATNNDCEIVMNEKMANNIKVIYRFNSVLAFKLIGYNKYKVILKDYNEAVNIRNNGIHPRFSIKNLMQFLFTLSFVQPIWQCKEFLKLLVVEPNPIARKIMWKQGKWFVINWQIRRYRVLELHLIHRTEEVLMNYFRID